MKNADEIIFFILAVISASLVGVGWLWSQAGLGWCMVRPEKFDVLTVEMMHAANHLLV